MRNGKIAKMPEWVREKLNERLEKGESGKTILAWMNEEPNPGDKPIPGFDGVPISKQNLSQWRRGGFREWQMRKEITAANSEMGELGRTVEMAPLAENLLLRVMGHYAVLVNPWDGKPDEKFEAEVRILRGLLRDATLMQRAAGQADKLKEDIRRRKREREDLWGGGGLVEAMRETLRKQREERVEAELQRRADAMEGKDLAKEAVSESGVVAVGQSESHVEAGTGVNAEAQRREDAKGEKDTMEEIAKEEAVRESGLVVAGQSESNQKAGLDSADAVVKEEETEAADCSSGILLPEDATADKLVALPGAGNGAKSDESELVAPSQSESNQAVRVDAKNEGDIGQAGREIR